MDPLYLGTNLSDLRKSKNELLQRSETEENAYYRSHDPAAGGQVQALTSLAAIAHRVAAVGASALNGGTIGRVKGNWPSLGAGSGVPYPGRLRRALL